MNLSFRVHGCLKKARAFLFRIWQKAGFNDVVGDDERISKHHAELVRNADGSIQVFDFGSTAGTFVNGKRELQALQKDLRDWQQRSETERA
jgi:hypothetical protein